MDQTQISSPVTKVVIAWGGVGVSFTFPMSEFAAMLAALYTSLMIGEWCWKRFARTFCERRGWVKPLQAPGAQ